MIPRSIARSGKPADPSAFVGSGTWPADGTWLHRFTLLLSLATLALLAVGGLVTSHGVGMAVPDWPNTYGYNMFLFPFSKWVGGILYEHSHRLVAAFVGLLTTILAIWLWVRETRAATRWLGVAGIIGTLFLMCVRAIPVYLALAALAPLVAGFGVYRIVRGSPGTLRWWGVIALAAVILQGVLGGLRVVWLQDQIGIFHATLAQLFFALTCALGLLTSRWWQQQTAAANPSRAEMNTAAQDDSMRRTPAAARSPLPRGLFLATTLLILLQLVLGATMRHQHAGLAIPDFPLAYGKVWPAMDAASVAHYNQQRLETVALNPITATQILLQLAHRFVALVICLAVIICAWISRRRLGPQHWVSRLALVWIGLVLLQALLGAATIWSNKAADIATAHVMLGALSLAYGAVQCIIYFRGLVLAPGFSRAEASTPVPFGAQSTAAAGLK